MMNRRKFLEAGTLAGVGAALPWKAAEGMVRVGAAKAAGMYAPPLNLRKFVDDPLWWLPNPVPLPRASSYLIPISAFTQQLHPDLPPTPLWGYGGSYPGPTIEVAKATTISVHWRNDLLPTDIHPVAAAMDRTNIGGMMDPNGFLWPDQRITTHVHGSHVPWQFDGGPKSWYTGPVFQLGPTGYVPGNQVIFDGFNNGDVYTYPNLQAGTTLWYHDHAMGITRLNVYAGLAGFFIIRDPAEAALGLPRGEFEIPIAIQDRTFNRDGTLFYDPPPAVPEFFGNTFVVNGKVWPRLHVQPRKYRFRMLNGCNARFLRMQFLSTNSNGNVPSNMRNTTVLKYDRIGNDGGLLEQPVLGLSQLLLGPAERADIIVDFAGQAGKHFLLYNDAATPFSNTAGTIGAIPQVMLFTVDNPMVTPAPDPYVTNFAGIGGFLDAAGTRILPATGPVAGTTVEKTLDEIMLPNGMLMQLINQVGFEFDPYTGKPVKPDTAMLGTTEIWDIANLTVDVHPIHTHQAMFRIIERLPFNSAQYLLDRKPGGRNLPFKNYILGPAIPAPPEENGWKDTMKANPNELTRVALKWLDYAGNYVYHCHILEHEEHDMMRALTIK